MQTRSKPPPGGSFISHSYRIWTDASQSEQLQTLRSVLTVRDVTLRDARPDPCAKPPAHFELWSYVTGMEQSEDAENSSPWTEEETKCLINGLHLVIVFVVAIT